MRKSDHTKDYGTHSLLENHAWKLCQKEACVMAFQIFEKLLLSFVLSFLKYGQLW